MSLFHHYWLHLYQHNKTSAITSWSTKNVLWTFTNHDNCLLSSTWSQFTNHENRKSCKVPSVSSEAQISRVPVEGLGLQGASCSTIISSSSTTTYTFSTLSSSLLLWVATYVNWGRIHFHFPIWYARCAKFTFTFYLCYSQERQCMSNSFTFTFWDGILRCAQCASLIAGWECCRGHWIAVLVLVVGHAGIRGMCVAQLLVRQG